MPASVRRHQFYPISPEADLLTLELKTMLHVILSRGVILRLNINITLLLVAIAIVLAVSSAKLKRNMKTIIYRISLFFAGVALFTACNDKNNNPAPELTNCTGCQFLFTENADLVIPGYNFTSGEYRVFWSEVKKGAVTQKMYIKAPMMGTSFELNAADIQAGKVKVFDDCPTCSMIEMAPIEGKVTGKNTTPGVAADKAKWLIEAKIIRMPAKEFINLKDTVYVKQYFTANFVIN